MRTLTPLPGAILSAEALNGTVRRLGQGYVALLDSERLTARLWSVLGSEHPGIVFSGRTAAWIWGAYRLPPADVDYSVRPSQRVFVPPAPRLIRHETHLEPTDVIRIGSFEITSALRTVEDILRQSATLTLADRVACRLLLGTTPLSRELLISRLLARSRAPHARRLRHRITSI